MSSNIASKSVASSSALLAHPFEAGVRKEIGDLRAQLTQLRTAGNLDPFAKSQVKNLEAQLGKKNAYLASLTASVDKPVPEAKAASVEAKLPAAPRSSAAPRAQPAAPEQSFGALGARLKGRLAPSLAAKLAPSAPPEVERF